MKLLGVDIETTTFDQETCQITEVGACMWDTDLNQPMQVMSSFLTVSEKMTEECIEYTSITDQMLIDYGAPPQLVFRKLAKMAADADYLVGHNGVAFDKPILIRNMEALDLDIPIGVDKVWIDTMTDLDYPNNCKSKNLTYLQAFHGFVNPFPHRALFDVVTMLKLLAMYNIDEVAKVSESPMIAIRAVMPYPSYGANATTKEEFEVKKAAAKKLGFRWCPEEGKIWKKTLRKIKYEPGEYPFETIIIGE